MRMNQKLLKAKAMLRKRLKGNTLRLTGTSSCPIPVKLPLLGGLTVRKLSPQPKLLQNTAAVRKLPGPLKSANPRRRRLRSEPRRPLCLAGDSALPSASWMKP